MGRLDWGQDDRFITGLCTIRKPLVWHPDLVPSTLLKDHPDNGSERSSYDDSKRLDDDSVANLSPLL